MLITGERHPRLILGEYADHYNLHRPHRVLQHSPPAGRPHSPAPGTRVKVLRRGRLGGLIREYARWHEVTGFPASTGVLGGLINEYRKAA